MLEKVGNYIEKLHMLENKDTVVAGVSGGADSLCLLHLLVRLRERYGYQLAVVHVNHGIRGEEARRDEAYVKQVCALWQVECEVFETDVAALAREQGWTEEEAGRSFRYQCFAKVAARYENSVVAVAHHMEDQAETVLFRMARGTGMSGLKGMLPVMAQNQMTVIRPLLCLHRFEIEAYLKEQDIAFCQDYTNEMTIYHRNYIRHEVVPALVNVNDKAVEHIASLAEQAAQMDEYLNSEVARIYKQVTEPLGKQGEYEVLYRLPVREMEALPQLLRQELVRRILCEAAGSLKDITRQHITLSLSCLGNAGARVNLPYGIEVFQNYHYFLVGRKQAGVKKGLQDNRRNCENLEKCFTFCEYLYKNGVKIDKKNYTKTIDCGKIRGTLCVRYRQPGDRIAVDIKGHQKSLKKFFIDEKIPQYMRDEIPLVCDGQDVVWIVGVRLSPAYYVDQHTKNAMDIIYCNE